MLVTPHKPANFGQNAATGNGGSSGLGQRKRPKFDPHGPAVIVSEKVAADTAKRLAGAFPALAFQREHGAFAVERLAGKAAHDAYVARQRQPTPFFVDWLTLEQDFPFEVLEVNAGTVLASDEDGQLVWKIDRAAQVVGSYDTSVQIRAKGHTVRFIGNVSRFGRPDNLFGFDLNTCLNRVNAILAKHGLPPFTLGQRHVTHVRTQDGMKLVTKWTGVRLTRIDLTANFETGSEANARAYLEWLAAQQASARIKVGTHGDGETVDWGRGSRRVYSKVYIKAHELERNGGPAELVEHCKQVGLVRFEVTVKATQLHTMGCNYLGGLDMNQLEMLFEERRQVLTRAEHTHDDLEQLPNALRRTARDWLAGDDIAQRMSDRTLRRHRRALLPYGIDIAVKRNVIEFKPRIRVIEVRAATAPSWYDFNERLAA